MSRDSAILLGVFGFLAVLVLLFIALVFWALPANARTRPRYSALELVSEIQRAEREHGLPPGLLAAVVQHESNGRWVVTREPRGGTSIGPAQVHLDSLNRRFRTRAASSLRGNLAAGAAILARSRAVCLGPLPPRQCRRSIWALYNAGSPGWWSRVEQIWKRLTRGRPARSSACL